MSDQTAIAALLREIVGTRNDDPRACMVTVDQMHKAWDLLDGAEVPAPVEKRQTRGKMVARICKRCGDPFQAREADVARGWGKFCSKSCKAIKQEQRTGQCAAHFARVRGDLNGAGDGLCFPSMAEGDVQ